MTAPAALPFGKIPELIAFKRHVWSYRDANGGTSLCLPPDIFTLVLDDRNDRRVAVGVATTLADHLGFAGRVEVSPRNGDTLIAFKDIEVLHAFLKCVVMNLHVDPAADEVASFCMTMLGFAWQR